MGGGGGGVEQPQVSNNYLHDYVQYIINCPIVLFVG